MTNIKTLFLTLLILCSARTTFAQNGIGLALGGNTAPSRGIEAVFWNPANLSLVDPNAARLEIKFISLNAGAANNSFNYNSVTQYIGEGESIYLTEQDKNDILSNIPDDGLNINMAANVSAFSFRYKRFGIGIESHTHGSITVPKDIYETVLFKLGHAQYDYAIDGELYTYGKMKISYGFPLIKQRFLPGFRNAILKEVSLGFSLAYLYGMGYASVENGVALIDISQNGILPTVDFQGRSALLGNGFGFDMGISAHSEGGWSYGMVFENLIGSINWDYDTKMATSSLSFGSEPMFIDELADVDMDTVSSDTTYEIAAFSSRLPVNWRMGVAKDFGKALLNFEFGKQNNISSIAFGGRVKVGALWWASSWKRAQSTNIWSTGFAFAFKYFYIDFGIATRSGFSLASTKGLTLGTSICVGM